MVNDGMPKFAKTFVDSGLQRNTNGPVPVTVPISLDPPAGLPLELYVPFTPNHTFLVSASIAI